MFLQKGARYNIEQEVFLKILVTGFKPFLGDEINPSQKLAEHLTETQKCVESLILPVEFGKSFDILKDRIEKMSPDYLLMIGQAGGRANICLEKIGLNWVQSEVMDESGFKPVRGKISASDDLALMSSFPVDNAFLDLKTKGLPVEISFSAGTYVCNELYFKTLQSFKNMKSVFIHVPLLPEQLKENDLRPSLPFQTEMETLEQLIIFLSKESSGYS